VYLKVILKFLFISFIFENEVLITDCPLSNLLKDYFLKYSFSLRVPNLDQILILFCFSPPFFRGQILHFFLVFCPENPFCRVI
jgi:hypothetical protein